MAFHLLHISDVHFGPHCRVAASEPLSAGRELANRLLNDLKGRRTDPIDAVVASGDFTWSNDEKEFQCARAFLLELARVLQLSPQDMIVVPGNHDIAWSEALPDSGGGFKFLVSGEAEGRYREFVRQFLHVEFPDLITNWRVFEKSKVAILALDSCRLVNKRDAGLGYVGQEQIEHGIAMLRKVAAYRSNEQSFFKIAVLHHHLLPALDLDCSLIDKPPADRRFSLTLDAASVLKLLLADNFALVLHGHLHVPFGAVERRAWGPARGLETHPTAAIAVTAAGSLSVKEPHAERNEYQLISIDDRRVRFKVVSGLFGPQPEERVFELPRPEITRPHVSLALGPESLRNVALSRPRLAESDILAERLARREPGVADLLFDLVAMRAGQADRRRLRELFDLVLASWLSEADPKSRYDRIAAREGVTLPEYVLRLVIAARGNS